MKPVVAQQIASGGAYALAMVACGVFAAGAGHGSYLILLIASSPLGILGVYGGLAAVPAVLGSFLLWPLALLLHAKAREGHLRPAFLVVMGVHYLGIAALPLTATFHDDWQQLRQYLPELVLFVAAGLLVYLAGQALIWRSFLRPPTPLSELKW
jgi:hypothetical protein